MHIIMRTVLIVKQPGHLTSMKKELGDCTSRLSLCRRCSSSLGGCSRSTSPIEMKLMVAREGAQVDAAVRIYICPDAQGRHSATLVEQDYAGSAPSKQTYFA